jgi:hypothetical protein
MADNKLYLTEGEARAVREGSNTVDMTDNQMNAMGRGIGKGAGQSGLKELIEMLLLKFGENAGSKLSGIAELMEQARNVTDDNKMVGEEVLTEGTTYDYDVDGNPTTFSFSETEEMSNKNGGIMKFAPGGNPHLDMSEEAAFEAFSSKPSAPPSNYNTGPSNPFNDNNNTINTSSSSSTNNQNNQNQYNQIVDSAGTGNINMEEIVDFREQSGMDGKEYSDFLEKIRVRGGDERFYDAGFTKGPSSLIENYIKKGGILGNILSQVLGQGKDLAMDKMEDIKDYVSSLTSNNQGVMATEEVADVQGPLTGENKFRENLAMGDPLDLFDQYNIYGSTNPYKQAAQEKLNMDGFGLMPFANMMDQSIPTNVNQFGYTGTVAGMDPQSEAYQDMKNMRDFYNQGYEYNNGGGLFPQMTPQDPLMNSFNKTPLSVLERNMGGNTRPQQYAPKTAAQMLGIVDIQDEEGLMGV